MKSSIAGFKQSVLIGLGLDYTHAAILEWINCYRDTERAPATVHDGCVWYVIMAAQIEADMPILGLKRRAIQARLAELVQAGVLASSKVGAASCYRLAEKYAGLVEDDVPRQGAHGGAHLDETKPGTGVSGVPEDFVETEDDVPRQGAHGGAQSRTEMPECAYGCQGAHYGAQSRMVVRTQTAPCEKVLPLESLSKNPTPDNIPHSSNEELPPEGAASKARRVVKPTVDDVMAYCQERHNGIDSKSFVDFYQSKGWLVGKTPMKDWRAAVRTWERRDNRPASGRKDDERTLGSANVWDDYARLRGGAV